MRDRSLKLVGPFVHRAPPRLQRNYDEARTQRVKDSESVLKSVAPTNSDCLSLTVAGLRGRRKWRGTRLDDYLIEAAISHLASNGGDAELQALYDGGRWTDERTGAVVEWRGMYDHGRTGREPGFRDRRYRDLWSRAVGPHAPTYLKSLRYPVHGQGDRSLETMTGGQLAALEDPAASMLDLVMQDPESGELGRANMLDAFRKVGESATLRATVARKIVGVYVRNAHLFAGLPVTVPGAPVNNGQELIESYTQACGDEASILPIPIQ
ncbi:hypothetical protein KY386_02375 [Candidatus Parcubacteria bacterium]|nr:hypothetical protein [Candidatus Parcubacteria bacterium]